MKGIIDILILIILVCGLWTGYKKGLIMGILGMVVLMVSIYGANLLSNTFSYDLIVAMEPFAAGFVEDKVEGEDGAIETLGWENEKNYSFEDLIAQHEDELEEMAILSYEKMGIAPSSAEIMGVAALEYAESEDENLMDAIIHELCSRISYVGCFVIAFTLIAIMLTVLINLPNLSYRIPHLELANDIGGTALGLIMAIGYCAILVWVLKFMGIIIGMETLSETTLGKFFLNRDIMTAILGI